MGDTTDFRIEISNEVNEEEWDNTLSKSPYATGFQVASYFKPDQIALNSKQIFIKVLDNSDNIVGQLCAVLHLKHHGYVSNSISKLFINNLHLGSLFTWKNGPIIHDIKNHQKICSQIFIAINKFCKENNVERIKGNSPPLDPHFSKKTFSDTNFLVKPWKNYIVNLPSDSEDYFTSLNKSIRYDIRKSKNNDLSFEIAKTFENIKEFGMLKYRKQKNTEEIIKNGLKASMATWDILYKNGIRIAFLARHNGEIVGGINAVLFNKILCVTTVINSPKKHLQAGSFLTWNSIKWAIENQCSLVDLSGANPSPNSEKEKHIDFYKSKWCGNEYDTYIVSKILSKRKTKFGSLLRKL